MRRAALVVVVVALGCSAPQYKSGDLRCGAGGRCPAGFYCAPDDRCWQAGSAPDLAGADLARTFDLAGGGSGCAGSTALLCDDFELGHVDTGKWTMDGSVSGSATVDGMHAHSGRFAMHSHLSTPSGSTEVAGALFAKAGLPITSGTLYARAWAWFASPQPTDFYQFLNFVDAGVNGSYGGVSFSDNDGYVDANDYGGNGYFALSQSTKIPTDSWVCVSFSVGGQSGGTGYSTGDVHLFVGGSEVNDVQLIGAKMGQQVGFWLGYDIGGGGPSTQPRDAWFDDVIVDDKPISCQ